MCPPQEGFSLTVLFGGFSRKSTSFIIFSIPSRSESAIFQVFHKHICPGAMMLVKMTWNSVLIIVKATMWINTEEVTNTDGGKNRRITILTAYDIYVKSNLPCNKLSW